MAPEQSPLAALIESLREDGLTDEARELDTLLRQVAWTTGTEFLGEFGMKMKAAKAAHWSQMSAKTRTCFKAAAAVIRKAWPRLRL